MIKKFNSKMNRTIRINELISKLEKNLNISERDMRSVLTQSEYLKYQEAWANEKKGRVNSKPKSIIEYQALLTGACQAYQKMSKYSNKKFKSLVIMARLRRKVDLAFFAANEYIKESVKIDNEVRMWLDRDPYDESSSESNPISISRVIGSRSPYCLNKSRMPFPVYSKRQIKLFSLSDALRDLDEDRYEDKLKIEINSIKHRVGMLDFSMFKI